MDVHTYTTMIGLCGPWQQLPRAMQLVGEMRAISEEASVQARPHGGEILQQLNFQGCALLASASCLAGTAPAPTSKSRLCVCMHV